MMWQRLMLGKPFALWDPHKDLCDGLLDLVAASKALGDDTQWRKVHHLELRPDSIFSFDPVAREPRRSVVGDYAYQQWLKTRVDCLFKILMRRVAEASQDVMVRLKRWLKC